MLIIDEGSRFRTARVLTTGAKQAPNAQACLHYLQEGWVQYFGHPRCLRLDPAGAFRSAAVEEWCDKHSIYSDVVPGEAHWKVGTVECAIRGVKDVMTKLCSYDEELTPQQALAEAIVTFNHKELVRGYSPAQHILGQAPDETGRFIPQGRDAHPALLIENPTGEFERSTKLRAEAEKALTDWNTQQRLLRAKHSRHRPCYDYTPGELVYYWRTQDSNKGRRQPGGKHGRFLGPARVLATETRRDDQGNAKPGGSIWLVKGRSLLKCAPEQLRRATQREELLESMSDPGQQKLSWTFHSVADAIGGTRYEDISGELPSTTEWNRAQLPEEEHQPARHRLRQKQPPSSLGGKMEEDNDPDFHDAPGAASTARNRSRSRGREGSGGVLSSDNPTAWWSTVKEEQWPDQAAAYWQDQGSAVEIEIPMPDSQRGRDRAWRDLGTYFVGSLKRRAVELSERKMTADEREAFRGAKAVEVKNFVASKAFEILPEGLRPDKAQAIGMRWILTWKLKEDGSRKPKARAVLLGYQDEAYEHRATTSPVMTRQTRQLLLQLTAWKRWRVQKGDVTGAFLQSRQYPDTLYCIPCPEICQALGVPEGSVTKVRKACYGLVDAPLEWYRSVDTFLQGLGFSKLWSDPCCWVLRVNGVLKGAISGHVDDFLFCGKQGDALWESKLQAIRDHFKWGDWEEGRFTQCGVVVEQKPEGFELSQPSYLDNLQEIGVNATRRKDLTQPTTDREKTQLRALLGGISWHSQQVAPYLAAEVSLLLTEVSRSSVETILKANMLLANAKAKQAYKMKIHAFEENDDLVMIMWVDAANGNRAEGGSTQGLFLGMAPRSILEGSVTGVSPIAWHSQKIDRACRSPGAAEAQAAVNGEDCLYYGRYGWSELLHGSGNLREPDLIVSKTSGCLVTDSRNVYDRLITEVLVVKGAEKRTSLELLSIKESQARTQVQLRWVHSEAQLANSLTKQGGGREYELYYKMGHQWRLVEDEAMMSAKRRRENGIQPLEQKDIATSAAGLKTKRAVKAPT
ncbi:Retrovirus-related Pol polyprotein from transposon TNT 1-94 [Symbiodinium microadriaticum]|uniref:Retrovirus-related Pol polyprotein from transposon TNT 1-94 n=1 Tax=Symbiodinium microadriaticum TaxID=2951 RepID=A0A1Q9EG11_SYMMI|nr:Retrovirus-related Pol polyprotein from transposon TNT 1-94 [Symbiodinium microadriaticum]